MFSLPLSTQLNLGTDLAQAIVVLALMVLVIVRLPANRAVTPRLLIGLGLLLVHMLFHYAVGLALVTGSSVGLVVTMVFSSVIELGAVAALVSAGLQAGKASVSSSLPSIGPPAPPNGSPSSLVDSPPIDGLPTRAEGPPPPLCAAPPARSSLPLVNRSRPPFSPPPAPLDRPVDEPTGRGPGGIGPQP